MAKTGVFYRNGHYYGTPSRDSANVYFDNTISGLTSGTVKAALDEIALWKKKINKGGLVPRKHNGVTSASGGTFVTPATNGVGIEFYVDQSVKTIRVTAAGGNVQIGMANFTGSLPTIVTTGADRLSYQQVNAGQSVDFNWVGSPGLFFAAGMGAICTVTVEVIDRNA